MRRYSKECSSRASFGQMKCSIRSPCWLRSHENDDDAITGNETMDFLQGVVMFNKNVDLRSRSAKLLENGLGIGGKGVCCILVG